MARQTNEAWFCVNIFHRVEAEAHKKIEVSVGATKKRVEVRVYIAEMHLLRGMHGVVRKDELGMSL